jgi:CheY-like chemotaxis protein
MNEQPAAPACHRVLVVEDNSDVRDSLRVLLEVWGYQVQEAADGQDGVQKALQWHPQVAVVDIGLPILDGYELARRVKRDPDSHTQLIALTAYGRPQDRHLALAAGFSHHLTKPADPNELHRLLEDAFATSA